MTYTLTEEEYAALKSAASSARRAVVKRFAELVNQRTPFDRSLHAYPGEYFSGPALRGILETLEKEFP